MAGENYQNIKNRITILIVVTQKDCENQNKAKF